MIVSRQAYNEYLNFLLQGRRNDCSGIVQDLLDGKISIKNLYTDLFQKSLYDVGELWEFNKISVAKEHLATAITEGLFNLVYPKILSAERKNKKAVISCAANEYHQIGGKMVADILELHGWESHFLGANTPVEHMISFIDEMKPDVVGLSLSVYFNMPSLKKALDSVQLNFPKLDIFVGGQAFKWGAQKLLEDYPSIQYISSLDEMENQIARKP